MNSGEHFAGELAAHEDKQERALREDDDPTPWCHICGAMKKAQCKCPPRADND